MALQSVQVVIELGHRAILRDEPTAEGFTHDWTLFVAGSGSRKTDIRHFVDKVVFHLHDSFKSPKRVIKNHPYEVSESGYGSFECRIDIYFRNKGDPRRLTFVHDLALTLDRTPDPIVVARCEKLTFRSPSEEFTQCLLRAGGVVLGESSSPSSGSAKTKHSSSSSDRRSIGHVSAAATTGSAAAAVSRSSSGAAASKSSSSSAAVPVDHSGSGTVKAKNVCVVEPQTTGKATAVVAPLMPESRQFTELFGEPIVKSDVPKKRHHHKDKKKSSSSSDRSSEPPATDNQSQTLTSAKNSGVFDVTGSPNRQQRHAQKRILEASLFGEDNEEEEETPTQKKSKPREAEDVAQVKDKLKADKNHDDGHSKVSKHNLEAVGNSRRSSSSTPEPAASKHVDNAGKSSKDKHSKHSTDSHRHSHSHEKHHRTSSHTSSSSTRQTTTALSAGKSTTSSSSTQPSTKDDLSTVPGGSDKRTVSPLKLSKLPSAPTTSSSAQNHSSTHVMDMKKLFGDDDNDDDIDDVADVGTESVKDDTGHKDIHREPAEKAKKHSSHGVHKKVLDKTHSIKTRSSLPVRSGTEKSDVQTSKSSNSLSSSRSSDKHRHSEPITDKRSTSAAAKSSGKPVATATRPVSATSAIAESKTVMSDSAAKSSKVTHDVSDKSKRDGKSGGCEDDLVVSDSDGNDSSEANDVEVCDPQPEKPSSHGNQHSQADTAPAQLPASVPEAKAANGEYISVLLELQKQLMSVADDDVLEKLTMVVEETGKYSITDDTFDFDLCRLDIHTVNKLKEFLATVAY